MTLITRVFYSTGTISAWLLEERRRERTSSRKELSWALESILVTLQEVKKNMAANSAPGSVCLINSCSLGAVSCKNCNPLKDPLVSFTKYRRTRYSFNCFVQKEINSVVSLSIGRGVMTKPAVI